MVDSAVPERCAIQRSSSVPLSSRTFAKTVAQELFGEEMKYCTELGHEAEKVFQRSNLRQQLMVEKPKCGTKELSIEETLPAPPAAADVNSNGTTGEAPARFPLMAQPLPRPLDLAKTLENNRAVAAKMITAKAGKGMNSEGKISCVKAFSHSRSGSGTSCCTSTTASVQNPGSIGHPFICNRPCLFFAAGECSAGQSCTFCHLDHGRRPSHLDKRGRQQLAGMEWKELLAAALPVLQQKARRGGFHKHASELFATLTAVRNREASGYWESTLPPSLAALPFRSLLGYVRQGLDAESSEAVSAHMDVVRDRIGYSFSDRSS